MGHISNAFVVIHLDGSGDTSVFRDLASCDTEAIDVEEGEYGDVAWFGDGEAVRLAVVQAGRSEPRVVMTPTGRHDLTALRRHLALTRPELAEADVAALQAFIRQDLAEQLAWRESRWSERLRRWLRSRTATRRGEA